MIPIESTWTAPRPDCLHPEHWHARDDESSEVEVTELVAGFVRALQPECVVETGAAFGQTTVAIGAALQDNGHGHLHSLELDEARAGIAEVAVSGLPVEVAVGNSLMWEPPHEIDFVWFDSAIDIRTTEYRLYRPKFSARCVVGFHDAGPQHGIRRDIELLEGSWIYLPTPRGAMFGNPA